MKVHNILFIFSIDHLSSLPFFWSYVPSHQNSSHFATFSGIHNILSARSFLDILSILVGEACALIQTRAQTDSLTKMPREFLRPSAQLRSRRSIFSLRSTRSVGVQHLHQGSQHPKQAKLEQNPAEPQDRDIKTSQHGHKKQDNKNNPLTSSDSDADALATNLHLTNSNLSPHYGHPEAAHRKSEYSQLSSVSLKTRKSRLGVESKASIISIEYNAVDELRQLLEEGIDINQPADDGNTPLAVASYHGDFPAVSFLLANGSDPNLATVQGAPPLYWASRNGHALIIQLLCSYGADPNKEARDGLTPLACSALEGHEECCRLLLELNAYPDVGHSDTGKLFLLSLLQNLQPTLHFGFLLQEKQRYIGRPMKGCLGAAECCSKLAMPTFRFQTMLGRRLCSLRVKMVM